VDEEQKVQAIMAAGYGFGALALVAPRALARGIGFTDTSGQATYLSRFAGLRNLALAQTLLLLGDDPGLRRRFLQVGAAMFAADAAHATVTGLARTVPRRAALTVVALTAPLAALAWSAAEG
jgi:hypothetical protein